MNKVLRVTVLKFLHTKNLHFFLFTLKFKSHFLNAGGSHKDNRPGRSRRRDRRHSAGNHGAEPVPQLPRYKVPRELLKGCLLIKCVVIQLF